VLFRSFNCNLYDVSCSVTKFQIFCLFSYVWTKFPEPVEYCGMFLPRKLHLPRPHGLFIIAYFAPSSFINTILAFEVRIVAWRMAKVNH
jgi:hypothetical protein